MKKYHAMRQQAYYETITKLLTKFLKKDTYCTCIHKEVKWGWKDKDPFCDILVSCNMWNDNLGWNESLGIEF